MYEQLIPIHCRTKY